MHQSAAFPFAAALLWRKITTVLPLRSRDAKKQPSNTGKTAPSPAAKNADSPKGTRALFWCA